MNRIWLGAAAAAVPFWAVAAKAAATAAADGGGDASLQVWIGGRAPTTTTAHYDGLENFMIVTRGRKTVDLWPPGCPKLARSAPAWAYREALCGNQTSGAPRHRRDRVAVTAPARWLGGSRK